MSHISRILTKPLPVRKGIAKMKKETKTKQIVVRFDESSYEKISAFAQADHRGLGEFVRHAALTYIENSEQRKNTTNERGPNTP